MQNKYVFIHILNAQQKLVAFANDLKNSHARKFAFEPRDAHLDESRMFIKIGGETPFFIFVTPDGQYASVMNNQTVIITAALPFQLLGKINEFLLPMARRTRIEHMLLMKNR